MRAGHHVAALGVFALLGSCTLIDRTPTSSDLTIRRFTATPTRVAAGATATLSWDVAGADVVEIDHAIGTVASKGSRTMPVPSTTAFVLQARTGTSSVQAEVTVQVEGSPSP